jgi:hypothetical protein
MPARPGFTAASSILLLLSLVASARSSTIEGNVVFRRDAGSPRPEVAETVVWVEEIPARTEEQLARTPTLWFWQRWLGMKPPAPAATPHVIEIGRRFLPRVSAVPARTKLVFNNRDQVWHGVFSVTPGNRFELGKRAPGRIDTLRVGRAGIVQLRCDIHPEMSGWVVVTPNRAYTRPDAAGHWELPELPPGRYVVRAWHPARGAVHRAVTLAGDDAFVRLRW